MVPFEKATLAEKQMYYYNGAYCIYCMGETDLVDSIEVYQQSHGLIYICRNCRAWVGVHGGALGDQSLGTVAKKALRDLRHEAHYWFDPLWRKRVEQGAKVKAARGAGYAWLANLLGIESVQSHIGYFNDAQCIAVIEECKKHYKTKEKIELEQQELKWKKDTVYYLGGELDFDVVEFSINGFVQLEFRNTSGTLFQYKPKENIGAWDKGGNGKKLKWKPVEDIEAFIYENFKR